MTARPSDSDQSKTDEKLYACDAPGCDKRYTRLEHLKRHKLNHNPRTIYRCPIEGCTQWFVREDLRRRHVKRHDRGSNSRFPQAANKGLPPSGINVSQADFVSESGDSRLSKVNHGAERSSGSTSEHNTDDGHTPISSPSGPLSVQVDPLLSNSTSTGYQQPNRLRPNNANFYSPMGAATTTNGAENFVPYYPYAPSTAAAPAVPNYSSPLPLPTTTNTPNYFSSPLAGSHRYTPHIPTSDLRMNGAGLYPMSSSAYSPISQSSASINANQAKSSVMNIQPSTQASSPSTVNPQVAQPGNPQGQTNNLNPYLTNGSLGTGNIPGTVAEPVTPAQFPAAMPPDDFTAWLFSDTILNNAETFTPFESPVSLHSLVSPPIQNEQLSEEKKSQLLQLIPLKKNEAHMLEQYLDSYWKMFHTQFPILHKPSFDAESTEPGLLWAIILVGAATTTSPPLPSSASSRMSQSSGSNIGSASSPINASNNATPNSPPLRRDDQESQRIAERIAEPLRWLLFGHKDFAPPAQIWVIQALLLLELYEKCMSKRRYHERAYVHHGTLLQLIRRGSALKGEFHQRFNNEWMQDLDPWQKWINSESAKRAVLMAFCLDVFDAALFGHPMIMSVHEVRLNLPCDEDLWESYPKDRTKKVPNAESFLLALKKTLNRQHVKTGAFGRRILLSGLLCISLQLQQGEMQAHTVGWPTGMIGMNNNSGTAPNSFHNWREHIFPALEWWHYDGNVKQNVSFNIRLPDKEDGKPFSGPQVMDLNKAGAAVTGCHWPVYHCAYIITLICPLEINKHAGCPIIMNHKITKEEQESATQRMFEAINGPYGAVAVWHAIQLLHEMFVSTPENEERGCVVQVRGIDVSSDKNSLKKESTVSKTKSNQELATNVDYDSPRDPIIKRPQMIYLCALFLWSFVYGSNLQGKVNCESDVLETLERAKDARLLHALSEESDADTLDGVIRFYQPKMGGHDYLRKMAQYEPEELRSAPDKQNIIGLLRLVSDSLKHHHWEIITEGRRLLNFCIYRSMGGSQTSCKFMIRRANE